jgi:hypothetical protein
MSEELPTRVKMVEAEWNGGPFDGSVLRVPEVAPIDREGWTSEEIGKIVQLDISIGTWRGKRWAWWHSRTPRI